jgi:hypothetical protein
VCSFVDFGASGQRKYCVSSTVVTSNSLSSITFLLSRNHYETIREYSWPPFFRGRMHLKVFGLSMMVNVFIVGSHSIS